jgi:hypothetical protein
MFSIVRGARLTDIDEPAEPLRRAGSAGQKLVRCEACGTWVPEARALSLRSSTSSYCSTACLERAADPPLRARKSAER